MEGEVELPSVPLWGVHGQLVMAADADVLPSQRKRETATLAFFWARISVLQGFQQGNSQKRKEKKFQKTGATAVPPTHDAATPKKWDNLWC